MRYALLADVHANLPALQAVLNDIAAQGGVETMLVAGDHLTAGPHPQETWALLRERGCVLLRGNNDDYVLDGLAQTHAAEPWFQERMASIQWAPLRWTLAHTSEAMRQGLAELPDALWLDPERGSITPQRPASPQAALVVHGSLTSNRDCLMPNLPEVVALYREAGMYASGYALPDAGQALRDSGAAALLCAHTHIPWVLRQDGRLVLNPGAVSGCTHGDHRAHYVLLDWQAGQGWRSTQRAVPWPRAPYARDCQTGGYLSQGGPLARAFTLNVLTGYNVGLFFLLHLRAWRVAQGLAPDTPLSDQVWLQAAAAFNWAAWEPGALD